MKLIFLDIDGVLNSVRSAKEYHSYETLDPECVKLLRKLVESNNASIVISSTWRVSRYWRSRITSAISKAGWEDNSDFIIGRTPIHGDRKRSDEITSWLNDNAHWYNRLLKPWNNFIAIDDDSFDMAGIPLVKTNNEIGLQSRDLLILNNHGWAI